MWPFFVFEINFAKEDKIFKFLKERFSLTGAPMDMIYGVFLEIYVRLLKDIIFAIFLKI